MHDIWVVLACKDVCTFFHASSHLITAGVAVQGPLVVLYEFLIFLISGRKLELKFHSNKCFTLTDVVSEGTTKTQMVLLKDESGSPENKAIWPVHIYNCI